MLKREQKKLSEEFSWDSSEARKIWAFGPEKSDLNILVDATKGLQYLNEIKDNFRVGFESVTSKGVLANEPLRGVKFSLVDATLHADTIHRGASQIIPSSQRTLYAAQLTAKPRLMEPIFLVETTCPSTALSGVYDVFNRRRGVIVETIPRFGTPLYFVKAFLPVSESFGFSTQLRSETSGQAFAQCIFDHFQVLEDDPFEPETNSNKIVLSIRKKKGLEVEIPPLARFMDKL